VREAQRGASAHGSCGRGIGETVDDWLKHPEMCITMRDLLDVKVVREKLRALRSYCLEKLLALYPSMHAKPGFGLTGIEAEWLTKPAWGVLYNLYETFEGLDRIVDDDKHLDAIYEQGGTVIFEGAQGVLLDQDYGFHPHTTWSKTTTENADRMLAGSGFEVEKIGVIRAYMTRHGAGPLVTEAPINIDDDNKTDRWQGSFRTGYLDLPALRYALRVQGGVDKLAVSCMDHIPGMLPVCVGYQSPLGVEVGDFHPLGRAEGNEKLTQILNQMGPILADVEKHRYLGLIASELRTPIAAFSEGKTREDKRFL
jgi:adenylosuccinate synthase